jgi:IS30 family transposase
LIIGKDQRSAIGTLVERQTRMVRLLHLPQRDGDTLHDALKARMADLPAALLRSITWDQGPKWPGTSRSPNRSARRSTSATPDHRGNAAQTKR